MRFKKNQRLLNGMLLNDIKEINHTLKLHGEAHMAQDLSPQFTELVKKVEKLEGQLNFKLNDGPIHNHTVRISKMELRLAELEESNAVFLKSIPDIEILKTQMIGLESDNAKLWAAVGTLEIQMQNLLPVHNNMMDEILKQLVRDVDTLKIQQGNTMPRLKALMDEVIAQKAFLAKVQALLDRERDARLVNSPSHKKELEALKMDKHVDMMVKKGRPRKP